MAGAGYKLFNTGDVLTAAQVNTYLMQQTVMVFADASARTTALSGVLAEGMLSYLQDQNKVYVYDGSAWVEAGASLPSQTGNSGKYLTTDGTTASWGTISAGSMTSLATGTLSSTSVSISSINQTYQHLYLVVSSPQINTGSAYLMSRLNGDSSSAYRLSGLQTGNALVTGATQTYIDYTLNENYSFSTTANNGIYTLYLPNYSLSKGKNFMVTYSNPSGTNFAYGWGTYVSSTAISSISITTTAGTGTMSVGTYTLYGVK